MAEALGVRSQKTRQMATRCTREGLAVLLASLVLLGLVFSTSHRLHAQLHGEARHSDQACLACLLSSGTAGLVAVAVLAIAVALVFLPTHKPARPCMKAAAVSGSLGGRAPPSPL